MLDPLVSLLLLLLIGGGGALLFWPGGGLVARVRQARRLNDRVRSEDALKYLFKCGLKGESPSTEGLAGVLHISRDEAVALLAEMQERGLITYEGDALRLTAAGDAGALHIIRAHRLWERYLADETGYDEATWHGRADDLEHTLTPDEANELAGRLGNPTVDPHGDPIPTPRGSVEPHRGAPLSSLPAGVPARIVHLEDEPDVVYAQIVAEGLYPGMPVRVLESNAERVRFWAGGDEHLLAPLVANNISVVRTPEAEQPETPPRTLAELAVGESATMIGLSPACRGSERRRLLDLGFLQGSRITAEFPSPFGSPTAYRVRGTLIALRREQARLVYIAAPGEEGARAAREDAPEPVVVDSPPAAVAGGGL